MDKHGTKKKKNTTSKGIKNMNIWKEDLDLKNIFDENFHTQQGNYQIHMLNIPNHYQYE